MRYSKCPISVPITSVMDIYNYFFLMSPKLLVSDQSPSPMYKSPVEMVQNFSPGHPVNYYLVSQNIPHPYHILEATDYWPFSFMILIYIYRSMRVTISNICIIFSLFSVPIHALVQCSPHWKSIDGLGYDCGRSLPNPTPMWCWKVWFMIPFFIWIVV